MAAPSYRDTVTRYLRKPMRKTFTFLGVTLILVLILLMGAVRPTMKKISELQGEITSRREVNEKFQTKITNLQTLQKQYEEKKEDLKTIDVFFPQNSDYSLLMAGLEKITQEYGYDMMALRIARSGNDSSEYPLMENVALDISLRGERENMISLLKHLESLPVVPSVNSVSYVPKDDNVDGEIDLSISMVIYKMK